jgi:tetratricopeptide (TPR) repeat protein
MGNSIFRLYALGPKVSMSFLNGLVQRPLWAILLTSALSGILLSCASPDKASSQPKAPPGLAENRALQADQGDKRQDPFLKYLDLKAKNQDSIAEAYLVRAANKDTSSAFLAVEVANAYANQQNVDSVIVWATRAWRLSQGTSSKAAHFLGSSARMQKKLDTAAFWLDTARALDPNPTPTLLQESYLVWSALKQEAKALDPHYELLKLTRFDTNYLMRHLQLAEAAERRDLGVAALKEAWAAQPSSKTGRLLAQWSGVQGDWNTASEVLKVLLARSQDSTETVALRSALSWTLEQAGRGSEAADLLLLDTQDPDVLRAAALASWKGGQSQRALDLMQKYLALNKAQASDLVVLASLEADLKDYPSALRTIARARELDPKDPRIALQAAFLTSDAGQFVQAQKLADSLGQKHPKNSQVWAGNSQVALGIFQRLDTAGKTDSLWLRKARTATLRALSLSPENSDLWLRKGTIEAIALNGWEAATAFRTALALDSGNTNLMNALGYTLIDLDLDIPQGLEWVEKALLKEPEEAAFLDSKAWGLYKLGKLDSAWQIMEKVGQDSNVAQSWEFLYHKALMLQAKGLIPAAQKEIRAAAQTHKGHPWLRKAKQTLLNTKAPRGNGAQQRSKSSPAKASVKSSASPGVQP